MKASVIQGSGTMPSGLTESMAQTISGECGSALGDVLEIGIDAFLEDGILKEIPVVSTAVSVYKIGKSVRELHHLKKFVAFLSELDTITDKESARDKYLQYFKSGDRSEEIEYLLIILDRYISEKQARMLACLYAAMLEREISLSDLGVYSQVVDRLLPGDYECLRDNREITTYRTTEKDAVLRLSGLGLMIEKPRKSAIMLKDGVASIDDPKEMAKEERSYRRTAFGSRLVELIERYRVE